MHCHKAHIGFGVLLLAGFVLAGCSKKAVEGNPYWTSPDEEVEISFAQEPLVIQFSKDPVVYISHIPANRVLTEIEQEKGVIVKPSIVEDIPSRIEAFKREQERANAHPSVVIDGDYYATCGAILDAIETAKRAHIKDIRFDTGVWRESGMAFRSSEGCIPLKYFEFPKGLKPPAKFARNTITITLQYNERIGWNGTEISGDEFVQKIHEATLMIGPENIFPVVVVDADMPFPSLAYVLDQIRRCGIWRVTIQPRNPDASRS
ncbi:biopolymer transport protein ExbD [Ereboglobus sp. PH5-10]|uniref:ExbD/TolR family protein n=1 Tax=Ereboglobus sp. PH5-10 TaxID=2940629 RepID=UPI002405E182|nr:hypothetical protein [Ereboglobus sp. PH5-10]MDF9828317.1 biopolymer transport protein ExbD [Ereboglobus sp. PH5-10]